MRVPNDLRISSISELSSHVENYFVNEGGSTVIYRGHGSDSFQLRPKAYRHKAPKKLGGGPINEELMIEMFRRQSPDKVLITPTNDWELLAIAQHHKMATRLLDWTRNPLVALYFAVCNEFEHLDKQTQSPILDDAQIVAWRSPKEKLSKDLPKNPLKIRRVVKYVPRITTPRLRVQSGLFTVHPPSEKDFNPDNLVRMRIPYLLRKPLKDSLFRHGINESVLFPDVDGLASHINWCQTDSY